MLSRREAGSPWPLKWMLPVAALLLAAVGAVVGLQFRAGSQRESPSSAPPLPAAPPAAAPAAPMAESPARLPSLPEVTPPATKMVPTRTPPPPPRASSATPLGVSAVPPSPLPAPAPPSTAPAAMATEPPRAELSSSPGFLRVAVVPWAEVTVDGRVVGTTPIDAFSLTPGRHRLRLRHPSYEVLEREVVVRPGETTRVVVNFPKDGVPKSR